MFHFLHTNIPHAIAFTLGPISVHWYGLVIVLGGLIGVAFANWLRKFYDVTKEQLFDMVFYFVIGAVIGARIYYVLYAWEMYAKHPLDILKIWQGGLAIHGVLLGGVTALVIWVWKSKMKLNLWQLLDLAGPSLALAQTIGRWGNYFNQEIFGKPTDLPWGIPIQVGYRPEQYRTAEFFHPTVMYESIGNFVIFGLLGLAHWLRLKKKVTWIPEGGIISLYFMLYSIQRFMLEFLRTDYSPIVFGIRWAMIMSVLLFCVAAGVFIWRSLQQRNQKPATPEPIVIAEK